MEAPAQPQPQPPPPTTTTAQWDILIPTPATALSLLPHSIRRHQTQPIYPTGCPDIDSNVLLGGFSGGCVVGISSEDEELSLTLALQTISLALLPATETGADKNDKTALIVSTLPAQSLVPRLRAVLVEQLSKVVVGDLQGHVRGCLSRISISRVFDMQGLGEVVDELSLLEEDKVPGLVLVVGVGLLMNGLFTAKAHDKAAAHGFVAGLAGKLRGVAGKKGNGPLVVLLNSTTSSHPDAGEERRTEGGQLREGEGAREGQVLLRGEGDFKRRESRPAWGQVFGQLVGMHLMVTRVDGVVAGGRGWVVEVLGDEVGVYSCSDEGIGEEIWTRRNREQRWGVVEVRDGRVVDVVL